MSSISLSITTRILLWLGGVMFEFVSNWAKGRLRDDYLPQSIRISLSDARASNGTVGASMRIENTAPFPVEIDRVRVKVSAAGFVAQCDEFNIQLPAATSIHLPLLFLMPGEASLGASTHAAVTSTVVTGEPYSKSIITPEPTSVEIRK